MEHQTLRLASPARRPRPFPPAATGLLPAPSALVLPRHCRNSSSADSTLISSQSDSRPRLARCGYRHRLGELYRRRPPMPLLLLPAPPTPPVFSEFINLRSRSSAMYVASCTSCLLGADALSRSVMSHPELARTQVVRSAAACRRHRSLVTV